MGKFTIDFNELAYLAEACMPQSTIARASFWGNLTDVYWKLMTTNERERLFNWMNRNCFYEESLEKYWDTKIFQGRFNPDNQYLVTTYYEGKTTTHQAFILDGKYYVNTNTHIAEEYIVSVEKIPVIKDYIAGE